MSINNCPICQQHMDIIVLSHRSKPFVDGKCYSKMCFGCYNVPKQYIDSYKEDGSIEEQQGPFYSYKVLNTPQELYENGSVGKMSEAQKCVREVKRLCRKVGSKKLNSLKLTKPEPLYQLNEEKQVRKRISRKRVIK